MNILTRLSQLTLAVVVIACTACATVGRSFNNTYVPTLEIGSLKSADYQDVFGKPWNIRTTTNSDGKFDDIRFLYAHGNIATTSARVLELEFRDGRLNAWLYISGFDDDRTAVDLAVVDKIQKTTFTKREVQAVLGKPHGKALCPSLLVDYTDRCKGAVEVWAWAATNKLVTLGRNPTESSSIFIHFDKNEIVTQVETVQRTNERQNR